MRTIGSLKTMLRQRGFQCRQGKGDHTVWTQHGRYRPIVLSGHDSDDAPKYQQARVMKAHTYPQRRRK